MYCYSFLEVLNQNLNLNFHEMDFWFEFFHIHVNEKAITCHDCHGFKWHKYLSNIEFFLCGLAFFWDCWIANAPRW
jgi:hypothetical protein